MKQLLTGHCKQGLGVFLSLLLCACSSSEDELTRYIHRVKSRPPKPIEPIPEFKPLAKFEFPVDDKRRSPFKPVTEEGQDLFSPNTKRPKQPLEAFPLDALQFVGLLKQGHLVWALISQPSGLVTRVKVGDYLGKNYGQVTEIKENTMVIEETVQVAGRWEKRKITIDMHTA